MQRPKANKQSQHRKLPDYLYDQMYEMHENGYTAVEIAKIFNESGVEISDGRIYELLSAYKNIWASKRWKIYKDIIEDKLKTDLEILNDSKNMVVYIRDKAFKDKDPKTLLLAAKEIREHIVGVANIFEDANHSKYGDSEEKLTNKLKQLIKEQKQKTKFEQENEIEDKEKENKIVLAPDKIK